MFLLLVFRATENSTHVLLSTPLNSCGTLVNETKDALIFWNEVRADSVIIDNVISRTHDIKFEFYCSYSRKKMLSIQFQPKHIFIGSEGSLIMLYSFFFLPTRNIEIEILDTLFSLHFSSRTILNLHVQVIKLTVRSRLLGASISRISPWSQPFPTKNYL